MTIRIPSVFPPKAWWLHPPSGPQEGTRQRSEELGQRHRCGGLEDLCGDDAQRVEHAEGWDETGWGWGSPGLKGMRRKLGGILR